MAKRLRSSWLDIFANLVGVTLLAVLVAFVLITIANHLFPINHHDLTGRWEIVERHGGPYYGCNIISFDGGVQFTDYVEPYTWVDDTHIKVGVNSNGPVYEVGTPLSGGGIILKDSQGGTIRLQKASSDPKYDPSCSP